MADKNRMVVTVGRGPKTKRGDYSQLAETLTHIHYLDTRGNPPDQLAALQERADQQAQGLTAKQIKAAEKEAKAKAEKLIHKERKGG